MFGIPQAAAKHVAFCGQPPRSERNEMRYPADCYHKSGPPVRETPIKIFKAPCNQNRAQGVVGGKEKLLKSQRH